MNWDAIGAIGEVLGAAGVILTLLYLAVQIRQSTKATNAASRDATTGHILSFFELGLDNQVIARARHKWSSGGELDDFESEQLERYQYYNFKIFENIHIQYEQGLFSDAEWLRYRTILRFILSNDEIAVRMWNDRTTHWVDGFRAEISSLLSDS